MPIFFPFGSPRIKSLCVYSFTKKFSREYFVPDYGKVGELDGHDWKESGMIFVKFPDGTSTACYDGFEKEQGGCQVSFWLK